jgi:hypothetical protein
MTTKTKIIIGAAAAITLTTVIVLLTRKRWYKFGWVGGQNVNGKNMLGLHLYEGNGKFKVGDTVEVVVENGDKAYEGYQTIALIGADDGTYKDSMITIDIPKNGVGAEGQASGKVRKV